MHSHASWRALRAAGLGAMILMLSLAPSDAVGVGLVAHWSFDESSGATTADTGPNGLTGTMKNGASFGTGISGNALVLSGSGQYADFTGAGGAPSAVSSLGQGTVSMWFKLDAANTQPSQIQPIFCMGDGVGGNTNSSFIVEIGHFDPGNNKAFFTILNDGQLPLQCYDSGANLEPGKWYNMTVVVGPNGNTGYLNGQEMTDRHYNFADASSKLFLSTVDKPNALWVGKGPLWHGDPQYFNGAIDEVMIYDGPLTSQQVLDYYDSTLQPPAPPPAVPEPLTAALVAMAVGAVAVKARKR